MSGDVVAAFQPCSRKGLTLGRVSAVHREPYRVYTPYGEMRAEAIGALLFQAHSPADLPATGDWVAVQIVSPEQAMVNAVLPRRAVFSRREVRDSDSRKENALSARAVKQRWKAIHKAMRAGKTRFPDN